MWPWQKTQSEPPDRDTADSDVERRASLATGESTETTSEALDALARMLRSIGEHAFDLESQDHTSFRAACEAWARHVLTCTPPPGSQEDRWAGPRRAWRPLLQFITARRRAEQEYVGVVLNEFRQTTWTFVQTLQRALSQERETDDELTNQLEQIRTLETSSFEVFRREVLSRVGTLVALVDARKQRQQSELNALSGQVSDLSRQLQQAKLESTTDHLTRLFNRAALEQYLAKLMFLRDTFRQTGCLLMFDLDNFKLINDAYGHPTGDLALQAFADCLVRNFPRKSDLVARYGGDEFTVVLPDTPLPQAQRLAERFRQALLGVELSTQDEKFDLKVSIGLAELGRQETAAEWLARADQALYQAKRAGRDQIVLAPIELADPARPVITRTTTSAVA